MGQQKKTVQGDLGAEALAMAKEFLSACVLTPSLPLKNIWSQNVLQLPGKNFVLIPSYPCYRPSLTLQMSGLESETPARKHG